MPISTAGDGGTSAPLLLPLQVEHSYTSDQDLQYAIEGLCSIHEVMIICDQP